MCIYVVHVCIGVFALWGVHATVCTYTYGGLRLALWGFFGHSLPYSLRQSPSIEARAHWYWLVSQTSLLQGLCLCLASAGFIGRPHTSVAPPWVLEICHPLLQHAQQVLYLPSHLLILFSLASIFFPEVFIVFAKIGVGHLKTCSLQMIS